MVICLKQVMKVNLMKGEMKFDKLKQRAIARQEEGKTCVSEDCW
jgi:hypothetical protein